MISGSVRRSIVLGAVVAAMLLAAPGVEAQGQEPTAADLETARTLYREGKRLRDAGDLRGALDKFKAAHALANTPVTGIHLARTYAKLGYLVEARETCLSIGRTPVRPDETERSATARKEAASMAEDLEPRIPGVLVQVAIPDAATVYIAIDGRTLPPEAVGMMRKINPGSHEIVAFTEDGRQSRTRVTLREGETRKLALQLPAPKEATPAPAPVTGPAPAAGGPTPYAAGSHPDPQADRGSEGGLPALAIVSYALAGTTGLAGLVTGTVAMDKSAELEDDCPNEQCLPPYHDELDTARTLGTLSTVFLSVAGTALLVGIASSAASGGDDARASAPRVEPWVGLGAAGLKGEF